MQGVILNEMKHLERKKQPGVPSVDNRVNKVCGEVNCNKLTFNGLNPTRPQTPCFFGGSADGCFIKASSSTTYKTTSRRPLVNLFQDDTWGRELTDLYVAHGEMVTNRSVPNLAKKVGLGTGRSVSA